MFGKEKISNKSQTLNIQNWNKKNWAKKD
jgi:hypothetical protein